MTYQEVFSGPNGRGWRPPAPPRSAASGRRPRPRTPEYRDVIYVEELIGPDTVNTMPRETVEAFQDHGRSSARSTATSRARARVLEAFAEAGIDYDDVVQTLEREGVEKFAKSFRELFADLEAKRDQLVAA